MRAGSVIIIGPLEVLLAVGSVSSCWIVVNEFESVQCQFSACGSKTRWSLVQVLLYE